MELSVTGNWRPVFPSNQSGCLLVHVKADMPRGRKVSTGRSCISAGAGTDESVCGDVKAAQSSLLPQAATLTPKATTECTSTNVGLKRVRSSSPSIPLQSASSASRLSSSLTPRHASAIKLAGQDDAASNARTTPLSASQQICDRSNLTRSIRSAAAPALFRSISSDSYFVSAVNCDPGISLLLAHSPLCAESLLYDDSVLFALSEGNSPKPQSPIMSRGHPKALSRLKVILRSSWRCAHVPASFPLTTVLSGCRAADSSVFGQELWCKKSSHRSTGRLQQTHTQLQLLCAS